MTHDMSEHLRKISSRNGRYWLRDSRGDTGSRTYASEELPFQSQQGGGPLHESVVVSIPNVSQANAIARQQIAQQQAAGRVPVATVQQPVRQLPPAPHVMPSTVTTPVATAVASGLQYATIPQPVAQPVAPPASMPVAQPVAVPVPQPFAQPMVQPVVQPIAQPVPQPIVQPIAQPVVAQPVVQPVAQPIAQPVPQPIVQPIAQPVVAQPVVQPVAQPVATPAPNSLQIEVKEVKKPPAPPKQDDAVKAARSSQNEQTKDSIAKIADEIVKQFPIASPSVVMFAGSQATLHTDESCARVAAELASRNLGRVLLIDSDFTGRRLTKAGGMSKQGGLSEVMNIAYPWQDAILKSGSSKLDFMPAGVCPHKRWVPKEQLRQAIAEIRCEYQFVCVSVGDAHDSASSTWSEIADGAFLLVSAAHSSDAIAESAVAQLRSEAARLIGCIVADVNTDS